MTRRRDLLPDEAKLWRRVAKTTKAYKPLPTVSTTGPDVIANHVLPVPVLPVPMLPVPMLPVSVPESQAPDLPHLALKRAKASRLLAQQPKTVISPKPKLHALADASGHKKVRRGKLDIDARIDLHGMRQVQAQTDLAGIIARTRALGGRCILVVTGKGRPVDPGEDFITPQPGVIRRRLPEWLHGPGIHEHVSGFATAHAKDGGSGAFYVLLKSSNRT